MNKIYNKDCIVGMKQIPDEKIDLVVTDPPFAINFKAKKANYNRTASRVLSGYDEIKAEIIMILQMPGWLKHTEF